MFKKLFHKKEDKDVIFNKADEQLYYRIENQDGLIDGVNQKDVKDYINKMLKDEQQFVTLSAPIPINNIRYIQAALYQGKIEVQIGIEEGNSTRLYSKVYNPKQCEQLFIDFLNKKVPDIKKFKLMLFK